MLIEAVVDHGSLENVKWLISNGCPWGEATVLGCRDYFLGLKRPINENILIWMHGNGCPME